MDDHIQLSGHFLVRLPISTIREAGGSYHDAMVREYGHTGITFEEVGDGDDRIRIEFDD